MVNADVRARVRHQSDALPWRAGEAPGVRWKLFEHDGQRHGRITALTQWSPGARIEVRRGTLPVLLARVHGDPTGEFTGRLVAKFGLPVKGWRGASS